jgi:hypothetical protein
MLNFAAFDLHSEEKKNSVHFLRAAKSYAVSDNRGPRAGSVFDGRPLCG